MYITDNPIADFDRYEQEQEKKLKRFPRCDYCGETIYETYYDINGETFCKECLDENFEREVDIE